MLDNNTREASSRRGGWLERAAAISMIVAAGVLTFVALESRATRDGQPQGRRPPDLPTEPVTLIGAATKGSESAKVALIVFSDFQCPYCGRFAKETLPELDRVFVKPGNLLIAFRHLPLDSIHPFARRAAESAWCAAQQNRFWNMHDVLFENPSKLDDTSLRQHAQRIGLELRGFDTCLADGVASSNVGTDANAARNLGVSGTPAFLLGVRQADDDAQGRRDGIRARPRRRGVRRGDP